MAEVTISNVEYFSYVDLADADAYLNASMTATAWRASDDNDEKGRCLVSATRLIDRQVWDGEPVDGYQENAFPRTGLAGAEDGVIPQAVLDATCELAALFMAGEDVQPPDPGAASIKRMKAGSVEIENFRGTEFLGLFPRAIMDLLGKWLAGSSGAVGAVATGTDGCSAFKKGYGFNSGI